MSGKKFTAYALRNKTVKPAEANKSINIKRCCIVSGKQRLDATLTTCMMFSLIKLGVNFWKCWNSKFEKGTKSSKFIDGLTDDVQIAEAFADHFRKTCTSFNEDQSSHLQVIYENRRQNYTGDPFLNVFKFDVELIETVSYKMKRGKAAGLNELIVIRFWLLYCQDCLI